MKTYNYATANPHTADMVCKEAEDLEEELLMLSETLGLGTILAHLCLPCQAAISGPQRVPV